MRTPVHLTCMSLVVALAGCAHAPAPPTVPAAMAAPAQWQAPLPHNGKLTDLSRWWQDLPLAHPANLLEAQALAQEASGNATRARGLKDSGALSVQQINQYLTQEQTAQARVEASRAALNVQQLRLKQTQVLAPDRGVISSRSATIGAVVPAGTELFRMVRQGRLEWRAEVTASELGQRKAGTPALITLPSGVQIRGKVRMIAPTVDSQTRVALVYVDLPASGDLAAPPRAGMFASGSFELGDTSSLTVPQTALVIRDGFSYVFRLGDDNRVSRIKVQTGRLAGDQTEITCAWARRRTRRPWKRPTRSAWR